MRRLALTVAVGVAVTMCAAPAVSAADVSRASATYCANRDAYEVGRCARPPALPAAPFTHQLEWLLSQLAGDARTLTAAEAARHFSADLLAQPLMSADDLVAALNGTLDQFGPLRFVGFSYPPRSHQLLAIVQARNGFRAEVPVSVTPRADVINSIAVSVATPVIVPHGRYSGWFDVGGRRLFLRCTGGGGPTVVFENGLTSDWYSMQNRLSTSTRACSYDPARQDGAASRSDSAPAPRTGNDRVRDLHRLLAAAHVPGPYVLAAHSNGGLFSLMYASRYPHQVAGLVLIDGVHPSYHRRTFDALKHLVPRDQWPAAWRRYCAVPALQVDWEQMDICASRRRHARSSPRIRALKTMALAVITHGIPEGPPGAERRIAERVWRHLQGELAALEPSADHVIARRSGHDIQHTQPGLVLTEIRKVVRAVRANRHHL